MWEEDLMKHNCIYNWRTLLDEGDNDAGEFWKAIGGQGPVAAAETSQTVPQITDVEQHLFRLSDSSGKLTFTPCGSGSGIKKSQLDSADVFILDVGTKVFIWIGKASSKEERLKSMSYAISYLKEKGRPLETQISRVIETAETRDFLDCFSS